MTILLRTACFFTTPAGLRWPAIGTTGRAGRVSARVRSQSSDCNQRLDLGARARVQKFRNPKPFRLLHLPNNRRLPRPAGPSASQFVLWVHDEQPVALALARLLVRLMHLQQHTVLRVQAPDHKRRDRAFHLQVLLPAIP